MPTIEHTSTLPFSRQDVFAWYSRPGALVRLHPPFSGSVIQEPSNGIEEGSESRLSIYPPGSFGLGLTSAAGLLGTVLPVKVPGAMQPAVTWTARHTEKTANESMTDEMVHGPFSSWTHQRSFTDDGDGMQLHETVSFELPGWMPAHLPGRGWQEDKVLEELHRMFAYREHQTAADLGFHAAHGALASQQGRSLTVAVTGASGMIGAQVCALLGGAGHTVRRMVRRRAETADEISWDPSGGRLDKESLRDVDVVINLAGHPLAGRFTQTHKRRVLDSRVEGSALLAERLAELERSDHRGRSLINGSAIGYYGAQPEKQPVQGRLLDESLEAGEDFLASVCQQWEAAAQRAAAAGVRVAIVRTGIVQTPAGGALQQMLPLFVAGVGGPLGGQQWQSWISIDDVASIIVHLTQHQEAQGPFNAVAPEPVTMRDHAKILAAVLHRPCAVPVPKVGPRAVLGTQGAQELIEADQKVSSAKILETGYEFRHPRLSAALHHVLGT